MAKWIKFLLTFLAFAFNYSAIAQTSDTVATSEDVMKTGGHIYIVLAIALTILAGVLIYMVRLERKIRKLEKNES